MMNAYYSLSCKNYLIFLVPLLLILLLPAAAEAAEDFRIGPEPGSSASALVLGWQGEEDTYYLVETTRDLTAGWEGIWFRAGKGTGAELSFRFLPAAPKAFYRLHADSDPLSPLALSDPDNDGIGTARELDAGMNALKAEAIEDTENSGTGDGLPDYWERFYFGDLSRDGSQDFDNDGIIDRIEWQMKTDPTVDDATRSALRDEFSYDDRGWLNRQQLAGSTARTTQHDPAGNPTRFN